MQFTPPQRRDTDKTVLSCLAWRRELGFRKMTELTKILEELKKF